MSSVHPARRRADRFDAAIEASSTAAIDPRLLELVELVDQLRAAPQPLAREAFVSDLRSSLMLAAEKDLVAARTTRPAAVQRTRRERRIAIALGGFAIVGATTSMAVAAQSALPGDVLYPLKRVLEDADTGIRADDAAKGNELLDHATVRLDELDALSRDTVDPARTHTIETTLSTFSEQASEASGLLLTQYAETGSELAITDLRTFTGESLDSLSRLETQLPDAARPALLSAAQVLFSIDQQAAEACPGCEGLGIADIPSTLIAADLGPAGDVLDDIDRTLGIPVTTTSATVRGGKAKVASPPGDTSGSASAGPSIPAVPAGGVVDTAKGSTGTTSSPTTPTGTDDQPLAGVGKLLTGNDQKTGTTAGEGSTPAAPSGPLPTLGEIIEGTVGDVDRVTGTLTDPLAP